MVVVRREPAGAEERDDETAEHQAEQRSGIGVDAETASDGAYDQHDERGGAERSEQAEVEEPARDDVASRGARAVCSQHRYWPRPAEPDRESEHTFRDVAVVGQHTPLAAVVATGQVPP